MDYVSGGSRFLIRPQRGANLPLSSRLVPSHCWWWGEKGVPEGQRVIGECTHRYHVLMRTPYLHRAMLLSILISRTCSTAVLPPSSPLAPCQHVPVPAWSKAKTCGCRSLHQEPTRLSGIIETTTAFHSALVYLHVTALTSGACIMVSAGSTDDLQQLLCLTALGRSCHNRSYDSWSLSCLVVTVLEEYKLSWKIALKIWMCQF